MRTYDPRYRVARRRPRPGRFVPQFLAMRERHDDHRRRLIPTEYSHWSDCDTCLALEIYDRDRQIRSLTYAEQMWLFAWEAVWLATIVVVAIKVFVLR